SLRPSLVSEYRSAISYWRTTAADSCTGIRASVSGRAAARARDPARRPLLVRNTPSLLRRVRAPAFGLPAPRSAPARARRGISEAQEFGISDRPHDRSRSPAGRKGVLLRTDPRSMDVARSAGGICGGRERSTQRHSMDAPASGLVSRLRLVLPV